MASFPPIIRRHTFGALKTTLVMVQQIVTRRGKGKAITMRAQ